MSSCGKWPDDTSDNKLASIDILSFNCQNGAYHDYICCGTCANHLKRPNEKGDFRSTHATEIATQRKRAFMVRATKAGFTGSQIAFLWDWVLMH